MKARTVLLALALVSTPFSCALAQERGDWRAMSSTAHGVTGDIAFTGTKIAINFAGFTVAQIRTLSSEEARAAFGDSVAEGAGNLYRTEIPGDKHFLHKNTLCGGEAVSWIATYVSGKQLQMALFSGNAMPTLTAEALANTTSLCGTFAYTR